LKEVASVVRTYGKMTVSIIGHPDAGGTEAERQTLANQRQHLLEAEAGDTGPRSS
jgi:outer membrane protein OmpA-like peptidoglycan-associated protein